MGEWVIMPTGTFGIWWSRAEGNFQFIMTHSGTQHDISGQGPCSCQLVTSTDPWSITRFLDKLFGKKKIALYSRDQQFNLGEGGNMGRNSCCPLKKKMTWVLYLVILLGNDAGIPNSSKWGYKVNLRLCKV